MRSLAVARYRLWTTLRAATPIFITAVAPLLIALLVESKSEATFRTDASMWMRVHAWAALMSWLFHAFLIVGAAQQFGEMKPDAQKVHPDDLMESAPLSPQDRFLGECGGVIATTAIIHLCSLPLLVAVAALSPLPASLFVAMEGGILLLLVLAGVSGASRRLAPPTAWGRTRALRSAVSFVILVVIVAAVTTEWREFRASTFTFAGSPSMRTLDRVTASIVAPGVMLGLLAVIYIGFLVYFFVSSTRPRAHI